METRGDPAQHALVGLGSAALAAAVALPRGKAAHGRDNKVYINFLNPYFFVFYIFLSICRFINGNACQTFAHCFVFWILKSVHL